MPHRKLVTKALQRYWRLTRGLTFDVCALVHDAGGRVLLVDDQSPGEDGRWRLPGGSVLGGETAEAALIRILYFEIGLTCLAPVQLISLHARSDRAAAATHEADQTACFAVGSWRLDDIAPSDDNADGRRAFQFFAADRLPHELGPVTLRRLEAFNTARLSGTVC